MYRIQNKKLSGPEALQCGEEGKDYTTIAEATECGKFLVFEKGLLFSGIIPMNNKLEFGPLYYSHDFDFEDFLWQQRTAHLATQARYLAQSLNVKSFPTEIIRYLLSEEAQYDDLPDEFFDYELESTIQMPVETAFTEEDARQNAGCDTFVTIGGKEYAYKSHTDELFGNPFLYDFEKMEPVVKPDYAISCPSKCYSAYEIGKKYENKMRAHHNAWVVYDMKPEAAELKRKFALLEKKSQADNSGDAEARGQKWYAEAAQLAAKWPAWETFGAILDQDDDDIYDMDHPRIRVLKN